MLPVVVGVGVAADRRPALEDLLARVAPANGVAFVVAPDAPPSRADLARLAQRTSLPIVSLERSMRVRASTVYIVPPARRVALAESRLEPVADGVASPLGTLFGSLASTMGAESIGVMLGAVDGAPGAAAIEAAGGVVLRDDGSPSGASALADRLLAHTAGLLRARSARRAEGDAAFSRVLRLLRDHTGRDFTSYKPATIERRIERRFRRHGLEDIAAYVRLLEQRPDELEILLKEMLIGVSAFFRDPDAFEALRPDVMRLVEQAPPGHRLRVWVAGCSTGEEAFSLAILFRECMEVADRTLELRIFGTDLDPDAIEIARLGVYPSSIAADVEPARLERFFTLDGDVYRVNRDIRELVVFAQHDLTADPPFTRIDLISCRNVFIYFDAELQRRLLALFHYALLDDGVLFLGASESTTGDELFTVVDRRWKIFRRKLGPPRSAFILSARRSRAARAAAHLVERTRAERPLAHALERVLLRRLVPPSVLVRANGDVVFIHGETGTFLRPAPGSQSQPANVRAMARLGLGGRLEALLGRAADEEHEVVDRDVDVESSGGRVRVDLRAIRLSRPEALQGLVLVAFENARDATATAPSVVPARVEALEQELRELRERYEAAEADLVAMNAALRSANDDLHGANEELCTAAEETQSLNEELGMANDELQARIDELTRANDDLRNLFDATNVGTLFLDDELRIARFNDQLRTIIRLLPADVGRPIDDLRARLQYDRFLDDAREVLRTLSPKEVEVPAEHGAMLLVRLMPYRTHENAIEGLVVTFLDVTRWRTKRDDARAGRDVEPHAGGEPRRSPFVLVK